MNKILPTHNDELVTCRCRQKHIKIDCIGEISVSLVLERRRGGGVRLVPCIWGFCVLREIADLALLDTSKLMTILCASHYYLSAHTYLGYACAAA